MPAVVFYSIAGCVTHLYFRNFEHQAASKIQEPGASSQKLIAALQYKCATQGTMKKVIKFGS